MFDRTGCAPGGNCLAINIFPFKKGTGGIDYRALEQEAEAQGMLDGR